MHDTAAAMGAAFFRSYVDEMERPRILEVGAGDVNGTLRGCAPSGAHYIGVDLEAGPGVDLVLSDPYSYPFVAESFDAIVSTSCFEHDPMFWLTFAEMCRLVCSGGFIYLNAPSNGSFHRYPYDNWRFYPDAGTALAKWGRRERHDVRLIESLIGRRRHDIWNDCVMVFGKGETRQPLRLLADLFPRSFNIRVGEDQELRNYTEETEDMRLQAWMADKLKIRESSSQPDDASIGRIIVTLAQREVALTATDSAHAQSLDELKALKTAHAQSLDELEALKTAHAQTLDELEALKTAHAQSEDEAEAKAVALEVEHMGVLAQFEKAEQERAKEAAATERSLRHKIAALGVQVSEARDRVSRAQAASAELNERARLAVAEIGRVQDEVTTLDGQLQAARAVSAHLVAALRQYSLPHSVVVRRRWWWQPRHFCRLAG